MSSVANPPPSTAPEQEYVLPISGFQGTPEEIERQWFERCYRGRGDRMAQLTWRAVIMGSLLGGILSVTNLYIGLKAGWALGVAITACILSYAIWSALYRVGLVRTQFTILENNCMQTAASAAGYSTGGTLVSAFAAYMMINGRLLPWDQLLAWVFLLAVLGVTMAVPMKRQMINLEQLRFPSGVAAAETLRALHGGGRGAESAKWLGIAAALAGISKFWTEGLVRISAALEPYQLGTWIGHLNETVFGRAWMGRTVMISWEPMFIAAGAITGLRVCISMMAGAILCWMVFVPILQNTIDPRTGAALIPPAGGFRACIQWTLWGGTACMVTSGLLAFALQWRSAARAFRSLATMFRTAKARMPVENRCARCGEPSPPTAHHCPRCGAILPALRAEMDAIETPDSWFFGGQLLALIGLAWLGYSTMGIPIWQTVVAVLLSFALALVACRVTGETDTTPAGPMGKITQLIFGAIAPGKAGAPVSAMNVNLMAANITAGAATSSAALLIDLKSGYLLGAHPRKQFLAQFAGIFLGTAVTVGCFSLLVPSAEHLGGDVFPAPSAQQWRAVAEALAVGLADLHPVKVWSIIIGGLVGVAMTIAGAAVPRRYAGWLPSAAGFGLAWTYHWYYSLWFLLGAVIGYVLERRNPKASEKYTFPIASGVIAGESLMGVALAIWENGPDIARQLFGT